MNPTNPSTALTGHVIPQGAPHPLASLYGSQAATQAPAYVLVQQTAPQAPSWVRQHAGQIAVAAGGGILAVSLLLAVAVVAVAIGIGAISVAIGGLVIKSLMGPATKK